MSTAGNMHLKYLVVYISFNMVREHYVIDIHYFYAWGLRVGLWTSMGLEACLHWIWNAVFVVVVKVSRGIVPFSPLVDGQCKH